MEKEKKKIKRKYLEVDEDIVNKTRAYCFLRSLNVKRFVSQALAKEIQPYEQWLKNFKRLKCDIENNKPDNRIKMQETT